VRNLQKLVGIDSSHEPENKTQRNPRSHPSLALIGRLSLKGYNKKILGEKRDIKCSLRATEWRWLALQEAAAGKELAEQRDP
jgi:hypothetical protein